MNGWCDALGKHCPPGGCTSESGCGYPYDEDEAIARAEEYEPCPGYEEP